MYYITLIAHFISKNLKKSKVQISMTAVKNIRKLIYAVKHINTSSIKYLDDNIPHSEIEKYQAVSCNLRSFENFAIYSKCG